MISNLERYKTIYSKIASIECSREEFRNLKYRFQSEIASRRRLDAIKTLPELLEVLEKRDVLNPENIEPLEQIALHLKQVIILQPLHVNNDINWNHHSPFNQRHFFVLPKIPSDPRSKAYKLIATNIGQKWQDFARALQIPEGEIDNLSTAYRTIAERVYEILRYCEENCDRRFWDTILLEALRDARRSDLSKKVEHIFYTS